MDGYIHAPNINILLSFLGWGGAVLPIHTTCVFIFFNKDRREENATDVTPRPNAGAIGTESVFEQTPCVSITVRFCPEG